MYLTVGWGGRLGNQMTQYISLLGQAWRLGFKPVIHDKMGKQLAALFPYISTVSASRTK